MVFPLIADYGIPGYGPEELAIETAKLSVGAWAVGDFGGATGEIWSAQTITPIRDFYLGRISQHFGVKVGGAIAPIISRLYTTVAGVPSAVIGSSESKTMAQITDNAYNDFEFKNQAAYEDDLLLIAGTKYAITFESTVGSGAGNYYLLSATTPSSYSGGNSAYKSGGGGAWPPAGAWLPAAVWDHRLRIYGYLAGDSAGEIVYCEKTFSDTEYYNAAVVHGARINNERVIGAFPEIGDGQRVEMLLVGYVPCIPSDIGKMVYDDGVARGALISYDNTNRIWTIKGNITVAAGSIMTIPGGAGGLGGTTTSIAANSISIGTNWPVNPRTYYVEDDGIKSPGTARQLAYRIVMQHNIMPEIVTVDFIPKAHDYIIGNTYTLRSDRVGVYGQYRLLKIDGNISKGGMIKGATFEKIR